MNQVKLNTTEDSSKAGLELGKFLDDKKKLSFIFPSKKHNLKKLLKGLNQKKSKVVGFTTEALMTNKSLVEDKMFVGSLSLSNDHLKVGIAGLELESNPRKTGRELAKLALYDAQEEMAPDYFFLAAKKDEELYLKGIQDIIGRVPVFGGSPQNEDDQYLICNDKLIKDGAVVVFFYTDKQINTKFSAMYNESKKVGVITLVNDKRLLVEINNKPALDVYARMIGKTKETLKTKAKEEYPLQALGVKDRLGDLVALRSLEEEKEDGSFLMGANLVENTAVILMKKTKESLVSDTLTIFKYLKATVESPGGYLLFNSYERYQQLENPKELQKQLKELSSNVDFIMPMTNREYGYADDQTNTVGNLMMSYTVFEK